MSRKRHAFTLVELLVVIGIIALLPAAAIGFAYRLQARQRPARSMEDHA